MKNLSNISIEGFKYGALGIFTGNDHQTVEIPSHPDLKGYLVYDREKQGFSQARFLKTSDPTRRQKYDQMWRRFVSETESPLLPKIVAYTIFDGIPTCVTSLPAGEPLAGFVERNGKLPVETAVMLLHDFVSELKLHGDAFTKQFALAPESIWISRSLSRPMIGLSEFAPMPVGNVEVSNYILCVNLLKFLVGKDPGHRAFEKLIQLLIEAEARSLDHLEVTLKYFLKVNPAPNYWMGFNEPSSLVESVSVPNKDEKLDLNDTKLVRSAKNKIWPALVACTVFTVAFITYVLVSEPTEAPLSKAAGRGWPVWTGGQNSPSNNTPNKVTKHHTAKGSGKVAERRSQLQPPSRPTSLVVSQPVVGQSKLSPELRNILKDTGFYNDDESPISKWLVNDHLVLDQEPLIGKFSNEEENLLIALHLKKASLAAEQRNSLVEAIQIEVQLLKIVPDSVESRIRLHEYLTKLRSNGAPEQVGPNDVEILTDAASENSLAREILSQGYLRSTAAN